MAAKRINVVNVIIVMVIVAVAVVAILALLGPQIGNTFESCTLALCTDGLTIRFEGYQPDEYTVEISTPDGQTQAFNCKWTDTIRSADGSIMLGGSNMGDGSCNLDGVRIEQFTAEEVTVRVTWDGGTKTETFHPVYEIRAPNGAKCGPTCHISTVTMTLP